MESSKQIEVYKKETEVLVGEARKLKITSQSTLEQAVEITTRLKAKRKQLWSWITPAVIKAKASYDENLKLRHDLVDDIDATIDAFVNARKTYILEEERKRQKIEAKLRREAEAEQQRLEAERLDAAAELESQGKTEEAQQVMQEAETVFVPAPVVINHASQQVRTDAGVSSVSKTIKIQIVNKTEFLAGLLKCHMPNIVIERMIAVNEGTVKRYFQDNGIKQFPGCMITDDVILTDRAK